MSSVVATAVPQKGQGKLREFSSSGLYRSVFAGVATSVCSVLIFLLDSSMPQERFAAGREFVLYASVLCAALVCTRTCCCGASREKSVLGDLRSRVSRVSEQVGQCMSELKNCLTPPQRRSGHDKPLVPAWVLVSVVGSIVVLGFLLVVAAFLAGSSFQDPFTLFDAAPRACGPDGKPLKMKSMSWSSMGWMVAAIWLSSGLCVTHPLTSGLILGF